MGQQRILKQFICLEENTEKFAVPVEKEITGIDKNVEEIGKHISQILQFINSARFIASSLSNAVNNVFEEIHRIKCKFRHNNKSCETCRILKTI